MPIRRLLQDRKVEAEEIEILTSAFNHALRSLSLIDRRDDPLADMVARKVIEIGAVEVRNPAEISRMAIEQLGLSSE